MRIGLDSVNHQALLNVVDQGHSTDGWIILGYVNGPVSAWPTIAFDEFTQRGIQVARIDVDGSKWTEASILDVEKGDVQNPATITAWVKNRADHYGGDPIVYCNESNLPMVVSAAAAAGVHCGIWLAKPTGIPPLDPGAVGVSLPTNLYLAAVQFTQNQAAGGGAVDVSMWFRDDWHPELAVAGHPADVVNQAYTLADPAGPLRPDPTIAAGPSPSSSPATSSATPSSETGSTGSGGTGEAAAPDPTASSTPPDPITAPGTGAGGEPDLPAADPMAAPASAGASPTSPSPMPSTPTPPAPAGPSGVAGAIDDLVNRAKTGINDLASFLHSQSFHDAAGRLESAVGEAVQLAGLISKIPGL